MLNIADCVEVSCKEEKVYSNNRKRLCDTQSIHNMIKIVKSLWGWFCSSLLTQSVLIRTVICVARHPGDVSCDAIYKRGGKGGREWGGGGFGRLGEVPKRTSRKKKKMKKKFFHNK